MTVNSKEHALSIETEKEIRIIEIPKYLSYILMKELGSIRIHIRFE